MDLARNIETLQDGFSEEIAWRKVELTSVFFSVQKEILLSSVAGVITAKTAYLLLFAHLQGAIRKFMQLYFGYVAYQEITLSELSNNFRAIYLLFGTVKTSCFDSCMELISIVDSFSDEKYSLDEGKSKKMEALIRLVTSNFAQKNFSLILKFIGLDNRKLSFDTNLIGKILEGKRNAIAHGEKVSFTEQDMETYGKIHSGIIQIMREFSDVLLDAARNKLYIKKNYEQSA